MAKQEHCCYGAGYYRVSPDGAIICRKTGAAMKHPNCFPCPDPDDQLSCFREALQENPLPTLETFTLDPPVKTSRWYKPIKPTRVYHVNGRRIKNK